MIYFIDSFSIWLYWIYGKVWGKYGVSCYWAWPHYVNYCSDLESWLLIHGEMKSCIVCLTYFSGAVWMWLGLFSVAAGPVSHETCSSSLLSAHEFDDSCSESLNKDSLDAGTVAWVGTREHCSCLVVHKTFVCIILHPLFSTKYWNRQPSSKYIFALLMVFALEWICSDFADLFHTSCDIGMIGWPVLGSSYFQINLKLHVFKEVSYSMCFR